jgi:hypothetical protein
MSIGGSNEGCRGERWNDGAMAAMDLKAERGSLGTGWDWSYGIEFSLRGSFNLSRTRDNHAETEIDAAAKSVRRSAIR